MNKKHAPSLLSLLLIVCFTIIMAGCSSAADVASSNISTAADNFEITRRIVFLNGITDKYLLVIEGRCSLGNNDPAKELSVTCKVGDGLYKKHFLGLSDNVTYFVEQVEPVEANPYFYRVMFRPSALLPNIELDVPGQ